MAKELLHFGDGPTATSGTVDLTKKNIDYTKARKYVFTKEEQEDSFCEIGDIVKLVSDINSVGAAEAESWMVQDFYPRTTERNLTDTSETYIPRPPNVVWIIVQHILSGERKKVTRAEIQLYHPGPTCVVSPAFYARHPELFN
jgi:hypothetical protein